jgi:integrase
MANFTIKPFQNPSGATVYRVSGFIGKRRIRENHGDETTALQAKQNHEREAANLPALPLVTTRLTECQAAEAEAAFHRLNGSPLTLSQAVEFALKNFAPSARTITVQKAFDEFMLSKKRENCRPATLRNLRDRLQPLAKAQPESLLNEITTATLEPFIFGHGSPINQRNNHLVLSNFFNWAKRNKYVAVSPLESVGYVKLERREVEILTVAQCRAVVRAARDHKGGKFLPFVTLALFCGIRPTEISRLTWDNINLQNGLVTIGGNAAKLRGRRTVEIPANAAEFLLMHATKKTPLAGHEWRKHGLAKIKSLAGLKAWPADVLRHTAITHHFAQHAHEGRTAAWAGNSPVIIHRHYKGLVSDPEDTKNFWAITPESLNNITTLNTKAA